MRQKRKLAIALTAAAMMTAIGAGQAAADTKPEPAKTKTAKATNTGGHGGCVDVDSAGNEGAVAGGVGKKYVSTVCDGQVYVLSVDESTDPGTPVGDWQAVGGPDHVLEATLASNTDDVQGGPLYVTVLTRSQEVWEGRCPSTLPLGPCEFTQLPDPPR
ncbi:hypothetical protein [Streptomyces sp. NPDC059850]|uniref:hypothetical protein n=1 Tax=Streptomyces sp. NPDC059850 TaxID=3346970 RepID=UPI00364ADD8A